MRITEINLPYLIQLFCIFAALGAHFSRAFCSAFLRRFCEEAWKKQKYRGAAAGAIKSLILCDVDFNAIAQLLPSLCKHSKIRSGAAFEFDSHRENSRRRLSFLRGRCWLMRAPRSFWLKSCTIDAYVGFRFCLGVGGFCARRSAFSWTVAP